MREPMLNAFTVDVENYFQVSAFEGLFPREAWSAIQLRVEKGLDRILELAAKHHVRGTFFALGWLVARRGNIVHRIVEAGHELGCHSCEHRLVYTMSPAAYREDLRYALGAIESAGGACSRMYRAPSGSITVESLWALEILAEEGIEVDSSIYPIHHDRYGLAGAPRGPFRPLADRPAFVELPPSTMRWAGMTWPCAGGGYLLLYPARLTHTAVRRINNDEKRPAVVYIHPCELDPGQPRVPAGLLRKVRHRFNLEETDRRIEQLVTTFRFYCISDVIASCGGPDALLPVELPEPAGATRS